MVLREDPNVDSHLLDVCQSATSKIHAQELQVMQLMSTKVCRERAPLNVFFPAAPQRSFRVYAWQRAQQNSYSFVLSLAHDVHLDFPVEPVCSAANSVRRQVSAGVAPGHEFAQRSRWFTKIAVCVLNVPSCPSTTTLNLGKHHLSVYVS